MNRNFLRILLCFGAFLATLTICEVYLRQYPPQIFTGNDDLMLNRPEWSTWTFRPNLTRWLTSAEGDSFLFRTNSLGLRGTEPGPKTCKRIVLIGDSFMAGTQLGEEKLLATRLEAILKDLGYNIQVINCGVNIQNPPEEASLFDEYLSELKPDIVIWFFFTGNDIWNYGRRELKSTPFLRKYCRTYLLYRNLSSQFWKLFSKAQVSEEKVNIISAPSDTWLHAHITDSILIAGRYNEMKLSVPFFQPNEEFQRTWLNPTSAVIQARMKPLRPNLVVLIPRSEAIDTRRLQELPYFLDNRRDSSLDFPVQWSAREMAAAELSYLDLTPALRRAESDSGHTYLEWDGHWSALGHEVGAEAVANYLLGSCK